MKNYSYEKIEEIMRFMAQIVTMYGEVYLPLFERMQTELKLAKQRQSSLDLARQIAIINAG